MAYDWSIETYVTTIEGSYMPSELPFMVSNAGGSCAVGQWLRWEIRGSDTASRNINIQSVMAGLMAARAANRKVRLFGRNNGCVIEHIHLL
ncbi:hypothetical protein [Sphingobium lignivorans]|uniref:RNase H type-1 domain-containing protein n=1 Tax=Sphingobium lignivorans TaxID=2735886 RepID=A0ABR6NH94_9SPHN|nr:hypothetical protein [Sphingobium lignivorans]MBB5986636.1 hypothetical protein [Sphingobium lignivorans]